MKLITAFSRDFHGFLQKCSNQTTNEKEREKKNSRRKKNIVGNEFDFQNFS